MKILTVVGARPQFIKAAPVSRQLRKAYKEILVHTGQHYDQNMSDIFFEQLEIPKPDYNLDVGSASHGKQTGEMLIKIEQVVLHEKPDAVMVYGDTNSTLAGALVASKLNIPVFHIEAGLRSYYKKMPEEQNRILTDHISTLLLCPTETAIKNLKKEGITSDIYNVGDVMYDAVKYYIDLAESRKPFEGYIEEMEVIADLSDTNKVLNQINKKNYYLVTVHRAENTDCLSKMQIILEAFENLNKPAVFPIHPRTQKIIRQNFERKFNNIIFIQPVGYLQMLILNKNASKVLTDSGGLQKEAYFLDTPCVTLRDQTEWVETLEGNWNIITRIDQNSILENVYNNDLDLKAKDNNYFGDGETAVKIVDLIKKLYD